MAKSPYELGYVSKRTKRRLRKLAGKDGAAILSDFFDELQPGEVALPAISFRIAHKENVERLHRLAAQSFIRHVHDAQEVYQLRIIGLIVVNNRRSQDILTICDSTLRYLAARFKADPENRDNKVSIDEIVSEIEECETAVREALRYLVETPAITARSSEFPNGDGAYAIATEQSSHFSCVDALVSQLSEWVGTGAAPLASIQEPNGSPSTRFDRVIKAVKNHPVFAWIFIIGLGITALSGLVASIVFLVERIRSWMS